MNMHPRAYPTQFRSLFLSVLFHILILLLLFIGLIVHIQNPENLAGRTDFITEDKTGNTEIQFIDIPGDTSLTPVQTKAPATKSVQAIEALEESMVIDKKEEAMEPAEALVQEEPKEIEKEQTPKNIQHIQEEHIKENVSIAPTVQSQEPASNNLKQVIEPLAPLRVRERRTVSHRKPITIQQLSEGFKRFAQQELEEQAQETSPTYYVNSQGYPMHQAKQAGTHDSKYAHVDDELARLALYSYMSKVARELQTAFRINKRPIYFEKALEEPISLLITFAKNGKVEEVRFLKSLGRPEFDQYIIQTIKNHTFPPLPNKLNSEKLTRRLDAVVHARPGANRFELIMPH